MSANLHQFWATASQYVSDKVAADQRKIARFLRKRKRYQRRHPLKDVAFNQLWKR